MANLTVGQSVRIRATVRPGPFSGEKLVSFETIRGPVSGFVRVDDLNRLSEGEGFGFVTGTVTAIEKDSVHVRVNGSFFNTNGLAYVKREHAVAA